MKNQYLIKVNARLHSCSFIPFVPPFHSLDISIPRRPHSGIQAWTVACGYWFAAKLSYLPSLGWHFEHVAVDSGGGERRCGVGTGGGLNLINR